jgi:hypothetical protein
MKLKFLLTISLLKIVFLQTEEEIIDEARKYGYDLTNPEDLFFHDICLRFDYIKKDLTLEYRRNFYFFPEDKKEIITFQRPIRDNIKDCFSKSSTFSSIFLNYSIYFFFPIIMLQVLLMLSSLLWSYKDSTKNTPYLKLKHQKKIGNEDDMHKENNNKVGEINKKKSDFHEFVQETDENHSEKIPQVNETKEHLQIDQLSDSHDINKHFTSNSGEPYGNDNKKQEDSQEPSPAVEKSTENYTFGVNFGKGYQFSSDNNINNNENKDENKKEKIEDKMKRIQYVYEQMNQNKIIKKNNKNKNKLVNSINEDSPIIVQVPLNKMEKIYSREEYFYFGYLLARIEDKRGLFEIYMDLLEQCQLIFKFLNGPFNIYEDRKLQLLYYAIKLNLYFLFNSLLIDDSVINDIYDNKNHFIDDFFRSLNSALFTYIIGLFLYYLTNIKQVLIRRRYQLMNFKITDARINSEVVKITMNFCFILIHIKLIFLFIIIIIIICYSFYVCYSFCMAYYFSQMLLIKCVLLSITISQITPLLACWFPAILRKNAIKNKNMKLYDITKIIELLYIPW